MASNLHSRNHAFGGPNQIAGDDGTLREVSGETSAVGSEGVLLATSPDGVEFEYDPKAHRGVLRCGPSLLRMRVSEHGLEFECGGVVSIRSANAIALEGRQGVSIACGQQMLALDPVGLRVAAKTLDLQADSVSLAARAVTANATVGRLTWNKLEQVTDRALFYARDYYQRIGRLLHIRADRIRSETSGEQFIKGDAVRVSANNEVRINGEKIHLG